MNSEAQRNLFMQEANAIKEIGAKTDQPKRWPWKRILMIIGGGGSGIGLFSWLVQATPLVAFSIAMVVLALLIVLLLASDLAFIEYDRKKGLRCRFGSKKAIQTF